MWTGLSSRHSVMLSERFLVLCWYNPVGFPTLPCWVLGSSEVGEARHLLIHEYSGRELEPPLGSPASHPAPLAAVLLARAQAADIPSSCSGPNCSHCLFSAAGDFPSPRHALGGGEAAGGLRDSCHVGLFSPETQTYCSVAGMGQFEATGLRARAWPAFES